MANILIVEDDDIVGSTLAKLLKSAGHSVEHVQDGKVALQKLATGHVDLVITDLIMPNIEGLELISRIRKQHPALKIIAISGAVRAGDYLVTARKLGAAATLAKPFSGDELLLTISEVLK